MDKRCAADQLEVDVLGPVRARLAGEEIVLGPSMQRALFAVLAVRHDHVVSREQLINAMWGEDPPATVEGSLYTYVSGLRRVLEPGRGRRDTPVVLLSEENGYRLRLDSEGLDVQRFDQLRDQAARKLESGCPGEAADLAQRALALWRGEAFSGVPGPFAALQRDRLAEARLDTLEVRLRAAAATGAHAELVAEVASLVEENPLREGLRALQMLVLYRCGRHAEALEAYQRARRLLTDELGAEPGPELRELHRQFLTNDPALALPGQPAAEPVDRPVAWSPRPRGRTRTFVGRSTEVALLADGVARVVAGRGSVLWLEGEPGIGKSELLIAGLADAEASGCQMAWGSGDELAQRFPLRMMIECLGVDPRSADERRARLAAGMDDETVSRGLFGSGNPTLGMVDGLVGLVEDLCADAPMVLVADDLQWVDEASLLVWHGLTRLTTRLPLLLVGACRPAPRTAELDQLRDMVSLAGGAVLEVGPLDDAAVRDLLQGLIGATPGPGLRKFAERAAGNPLYVGELVDVLVREKVVETGSGAADVHRAAAFTVPASLSSAVAHRLGFLSPETSEVLRRAALLGMEFSVGDLSVVMGRPASDLLASVDEAATSNVLVDAGQRLAFRHPLIRQALYDGMPAAVRLALHRRAAEALDAAGGAPERVAAQLAAEPGPIDSWTIDWLLAHGEEVARRASEVVFGLLRLAVDGCAADDPRREDLLTRLARVTFRSGRLPETEARSVLTTTTDPELAGEMRWIIAYVLYRQGELVRAVQVLRDAVSSSDVPDLWRARYQALLSTFLGVGLGDFDTAEDIAHSAIGWAGDVGDPFAKAYALEGLWLFRSIRRDHRAALDFADRALEVVGDRADLADLHLSLLDNRVFSLQNLDRLVDADSTLNDARALADRYRLHGGLPISTAVHHYWCGRWDDALAELATVVATNPETAFFGLRERSAALLLLDGVAALIAVQRDDSAAVASALDAADSLPLLTIADRENCDFLFIAEALAFERDGRAEESLTVLEPALDPSYAPMMLRHQWLPDVVRLALRVGDKAVARRAMEVCQGEADREVVPARAFAAALRCRGLIEGTPEPVLAAAAHYRSVNRVVELAQTLEDAAVLLARAGERDGASATFEEARRTYQQFGARWAIRRGEQRLSAEGMEEG